MKKIKTNKYHKHNQILRAIKRALERSCGVSRIKRRKHERKTKEKS